MPNHVSRFVAGVGQHLRHPLLGGKDYRQLVGPVVVEEKAVQVLFGIRLYQTGRGPLKSDPLQILFVADLVRPSITSCMTAGRLRGRFRPRRLAAPAGICPSPAGERRRSGFGAGRSPGPPTSHTLESVGVKGYRGHPVLGAVYGHPVHGDRRRTGASMAHPYDRGITVSLDLLPGGGIVLRVDGRHRHELRLYAGHVLGKPGLHLHQEFVPSHQSGHQPNRRFCRPGYPAVAPFPPGLPYSVDNPWGSKPSFSRHPVKIFLRSPDSQPFPLQTSLEHHDAHAKKRVVDHVGP